jgi:hypothetical protein
MSYIKRKADTVLLQWKTDPDRKPILLRGARQVGKSSTVEQFGRNFEHFVPVNFGHSFSPKTFIICISRQMPGIVEKIPFHRRNAGGGLQFSEKQ